MIVKLVVVVRSDEGTVQRSLALDTAPATLEQLCDDLKTLDLRLQALPFTVSVVRNGDGASPVELNCDQDVLEAWKPENGVLNLDVRIHGSADAHSIFSSTYFGSEVASLIIYPPLQNGVNAEADVVEKQLVIPLTSALSSLKRAIYSSLPATAGLRAADLTVFHVVPGTSRELVPLTTDDAAEELLRNYAKKGSAVTVTYRAPAATPRRKPVSTGAATAPGKSKEVPNVPLDTNQSVAPSSPPVPSPAAPSPDASAVKPPQKSGRGVRADQDAACSPTARKQSVSDASAAMASPPPPPAVAEPKPSVETNLESHSASEPRVESCAAVEPKPSAEPAATPIAACAAETTQAEAGAPDSQAVAQIPVSSPRTRDRCAKVRVARKADLSDAQMSAFWYDKKEVGILERLQHICSDVIANDTVAMAPVSLNVLSGGQLAPLKDDADLREWLVMTRESDTVLNIIVSPRPAAEKAVTPKQESPMQSTAPPPPSELTPLPTTESPSCKKSDHTSPIAAVSPLTPTPPPPRAAHSAAAAPPPRRLSFMEAAASGVKPSSADEASPRGSKASHACAAAAVATAASSPSNSVGTGSSSIPSHTDVAGPLKPSLSPQDDDVVPVFLCAPPSSVDHTGLEALVQIYVRWGDAEAFVQCTLRPGLMLEDLKTAIFDEFNLPLRATSSMSLFVRDRWQTPDMGDALDTEAKVRTLVESGSAELVVVDVRATTRTSAAVKEPTQFVKPLTHKLAQRLFYLLSSDSEMAALQRLVEPCEARLAAAPKSGALGFFSTIRALSPTLSLPRSVKGLEEFIGRLLEDMPAVEAVQALQHCMAQCHCLVIAQPLSLLRDQYFSDATFDDVRQNRKVTEEPATELAMAQNVVHLFCGEEKPVAALDEDQISSAAPEEDQAKQGVTTQLSRAADYLTSLFAKDVRCMSGLSKARAAGAFHIHSRLAEPQMEVRNILVEHIRRELKHSFDSCSSTKLEAFIQSPDVTATPAHDAVLSIVGGLLAPHPVANGTLWLREHFKSKMSDVLYTKMRTFDRSDAVALPHLVRCCWTILDPALDPSQLLSSSSSASCVARWVLLALQLECLHRGLIFPPPPPFNVVQKGPRPVSFSNLAFRADSTISSSIPSTTLGARRPRERGKGKKVQYRYKFNWNELGSPKAFDRAAAKKL